MRRKLLQRGRGLGSILRLFTRGIRAAVPLVKKTGSLAVRALKSKTGKKIAKKVLKTAADVGSDLIAGKSNVKSRKNQLQNDLKKIAQKVILKHVEGGKKNRGQKKRKKSTRRKKARSIFA